MPIEINEVHIRVTVNEACDSGAPSGSAPAAQGSSAAPEKLLEQSVEQVFDILRAKRER